MPTGLETVCRAKGFFRKWSLELIIRSENNRALFTYSKWTIETFKICSKLPMKTLETMSLTSNFTPCSSVSIVDFQHAFVCRGNFTDYLLTFDKAVARSSEKSSARQIWKHLSKNLWQIFSIFLSATWQAWGQLKATVKKSTSLNKSESLPFVISFSSLGSSKI